MSDESNDSEVLRRSAAAPPIVSDSSLLTHHSSLPSLIANFLFPPRCVVCRARGDWLCARCHPQLTLFVPPFCPRCGAPAEYTDVPCDACRGVRLPVTALRSCGYFEGALRQAVHRLKFNGERYLAEPLAGLMAATWKESPLAVDLIVPVPLSPRRRSQRGYNQSGLLARHLGKMLALPVDEQSLVRVREAPPQMGLDRAERLANLNGAFLSQGDALRDRRVCLLDDVTTTGATLTTCAQALREAGTKNVCAIVLARTR
ncbi:MAG: ComF family protein [Chloroflexota bacterium]